MAKHPFLSQGTLSMRPFTIEDLQDFSALHGDPEVMHDLGGPINVSHAKAKLERYIDAFDRYGHGRFAVFERDVFAGYVGVMHRPNEDHPLGAHNEIGWRIHRAFWGKGVASRAAKLALDDAFDRAELPSVLAYTAPDNTRSQAVMGRLGFARNTDMDFSEPYEPVGVWTGLVWHITAEDWQARHRSGGME